MAVSAKGYDMADPKMQKPLRPMRSMKPPTSDDTFVPTPAEMAELEAIKQRQAAGLMPPSRMQGPAPTTKTTMGRMYRAGGYVRAADGIASKGKTRGKMC